MRFLVAGLAVIGGLTVAAFLAYVEGYIEGMIRHRRKRRRS